MNAKELKALLLKDEEKRNQYYEMIEAFVGEGLGKEEAAVKAAAKLGCELSADDLLKADKEGNPELSEDELDAVSGGVFWLGDDAPDGHELTCIYAWYHGLLDFFSSNKDKYCWFGGGRKHEFSRLYTAKGHKYGWCSLCNTEVRLD